MQSLGFRRLGLRGVGSTVLNPEPSLLKSPGFLMKDPRPTREPFSVLGYWAILVSHILNPKPLNPKTYTPKP